MENRETPARPCASRWGPTALVTDMTHLFGVTARAVRYYDQCGLLSVPRDHLNRRIYDWRARVRLQIIVVLRRCGLGLPEVRQVLAAEDAGPEAQLTLSRELIEARRRDLQRQVDRLDSALVQLGETLTPSGADAGLLPGPRSRLVGRPRRANG